MSNTNPSFSGPASATRRATDAAKEAGDFVLDIFTLLIAMRCPTKSWGGGLGTHVAKRGTRFEAVEPVRRAVHEQFSRFAEGIACGVRLRHDQGSQFMSDDCQAEIASLGTASSPAFVGEPEGKGRCPTRS